MYGSSLGSSHLLIADGEIFFARPNLGSPPPLFLGVFSTYFFAHHEAKVQPSSDSHSINVPQAQQDRACNRPCTEQLRTYLGTAERSR